MCHMSRTIIQSIVPNHQKGAWERGRPTRNREYVSAATFCAAAEPLAQRPGHLPIATETGSCALCQRCVHCGCHRLRARLGVQLRGVEFESVGRCLGRTNLFT